MRDGVGVEQRIQLYRDAIEIERKRTERKRVEEIAVAQKREEERLRPERERQQAIKDLSFFFGESAEYKWLRSMLKESDQKIVLWDNLRERTYHMEGVYCAITGDGPRLIRCGYMHESDAGNCDLLQIVTGVEEHGFYGSGKGPCKNIVLLLPYIQKSAHEIAFKILGKTLTIEP